MRNPDEHECVHDRISEADCPPPLPSDERNQSGFPLVVVATYFRRRRLDPNGLNLKGFIMAGSPGELTTSGS